MSDVYLIGSGGHCRSVIALAKNCQKEIKSIYDDSFDGIVNEKILSIPLAGKLSQVPKDLPIILAVGNNETRESLYNKFNNRILLKSLISDTSIIEIETNIGSANMLFHRSVINAAATIGHNNIINTGAIVEHEAIIGNHCHISVNAVISGRAIVGDLCFIGAGSVIKDTVSICPGTTIGAGSTVINDIEKPGTYVGSPAKMIK